MDVGCPKCQTEYELDDARVTEDGVTVKCTSCGHVFRVKKKQLVVTLPVKDQTGSVPELPPAPPSREWKLRQSNGNIVPCRDLTMLQKWIIEGKVQRSDEISLTGETWKRLGDIPELASFFQIFDDAAKARALEAQQKVGPTGGKITETWRGGQFTAPAPEPLVPREQLEPETLPPEPPPRKRDTGKLPDFSTPPPVNQTIQGGRFSAAAPPVTETLQGGRFSAPPAPPVVQPPPQRAPTPPRSEPSDEDLRRAVKGGGSGKWILLVIAGLALGGGVGWYFGVYEPQQKRLAEEQAAALREKARLEEEARVKALEAAKAAEAVAVLDASVEVEADA
ncbi:MAG: zinc-ribbon domain-containing protein, partial [Myxococcota bacterium]